MFVTPNTEKVNFGVHYSYTPQSNSSNEPKEGDSGGERREESFSSPHDSGDKLTSQLLARQVSGLISNKELSICESLGTFQSI
jgi:hypothetical protein